MAEVLPPELSINPGKAFIIKLSTRCAMRSTAMTKGMSSVDWRINLVEPTSGTARYQLGKCFKYQLGGHYCM
jgi:hypothetical protein